MKNRDIDSIKFTNPGTVSSPSVTGGLGGWGTSWSPQAFPSTGKLGYSGAIDPSMLSSLMGGMGGLNRFSMFKQKTPEEEAMAALKGGGGMGNAGSQQQPPLGF